MDEEKENEARLRRCYAVDLRGMGMSFSEIGRHLSISASRARGLVITEQQRRESGYYETRGVAFAMAKSRKDERAMAKGDFKSVQERRRIERRGLQYKGKPVYDMTRKEMIQALRELLEDKT